MHAGYTKKVIVKYNRNKNQSSYTTEEIAIIVPSLQIWTNQIAPIQVHLHTYL